MKADVEIWANKCFKCQKFMKTTNHPDGNIQFRGTEVLLQKTTHVDLVVTSTVDFMAGYFTNIKEYISEWTKAN